MNGTPVGAKNKKRIAEAFGIIALLMMVLILRVAWHQIVRADELSEKAVTQQTSDIPISAKRGNIYDRNGKEMATSVTGYSVWIWPKRLKGSYQDDKYDQALMKLAAVLGENTDRLKKKLETDSNLVRISGYIDKEQAEQVKELGIAGVETAEATKRYYPLGNSCSQLLGSVSDDNEGRSGIEAEFNADLSGVSGRVVHDTDATGNSLSFGNKRFYRQQDGYSVVLTIDEMLQHYAEKAAAKCKKKTRADKVMCLVMDPRTGDILAMVTDPGFDPNEATKPLAADKNRFRSMSAKKQTEYLSKMWKNPIVSDLYEPGSTFKLITTSSALEEGVTTLKTKYYDKGYINVQGTRLNCWDRAGHGKQTLVEAVGNSCNPVQVKLVLKMGADKYYDYLEMYGINDITGVDIPGETSAIIKDKDSMSLVDLATTSYGHGIALTPIQLLTAECAIGNDGVMMKPRIVKELVDNEGKTVKEYKTQKIRKVISSKTADEMRGIMQYVVDEGGAGTAKIPGYKIGGKTGTANKAKNGKYSSETWSSFVGMAPMDDPKLAVLMVVDHPRGAIYGSVVAAPYVKGFLEDALPYLNVDPEYSKDELKERNSETVYVPDVVHASADSAMGIIRGNGLKCEVSPKSDENKDFKVRDQYPKAGTKVNRGDTVYIYSE